MTSAIYIFNEGIEDVPGLFERQVLNYSSIGDKIVEPFLKSQNGKTCSFVDRGYGHKRHVAILVLDEPGLIAAAKAAGIEVHVTKQR